ncbi:hypothetical protein MTO96_028274, partial [Rhipicephalus appendiculatus]
VAQSTELQLLSLQELYTIIDSDQLKVRSEVEVLSTMLNWADGDVARTEALPTLVPLLRLAFTSMPDLYKILRQVHANENCLSVIRFVCEDRHPRPKCCTTIRRSTWRRPQPTAVVEATPSE